MSLLSKTSQFFSTPQDGVKVDEQEGQGNVAVDLGSQLNLDVEIEVEAQLQRVLLLVLLGVHHHLRRHLLHLLLLRLLLVLLLRLLARHLLVVDVLVGPRVVHLLPGLLLLRRLGGLPRRLLLGGRGLLRLLLLGGAVAQLGAVIVAALALGVLKLGVVASLVVEGLALLVLLILLWHVVLASAHSGLRLVSSRRMASRVCNSRLVVPCSRSLGLT